MTSRQNPLFIGLVLLTAFFGETRASAQISSVAAPVVGTPTTEKHLVSQATNSETLSAPSTSVESSATDDLLKKADGHLAAGRQLYFQGNAIGARREFDSAVETLLGASDSLPDHRRVERRLDEMCELIYRFDIEKLGAGKQDDDAVQFDKAPIDEISHMTFPLDEKLTPKIKTEVNETSSGIPLELSDPVLSYVHYFSTDAGRRTLLAGFKRSGQYRPLIQRVFAEEGVPQELVYLAQAESGFLPRAVSNKNAVGMWQFIAGTGAQYDLVHTATFDERLDPEKATRAAAKYLKDLYTRYGDWYLAMAAYNCGAGAVDRAIERTGYADYWELLKRHALPRETSNYVPIIVAMTIMAKNPKDYGLEHLETDSPLDYESLQLEASTNLNLIADATLQPLSVLRDLNPSLLKVVAPAGFRIHVPIGSATIAQAALNTVPASNRNAWRLHHVETGDTLVAIARSYHLAPERIVAVNHSADSLEAGDVLLIPAAYQEEKSPVRARSRFSRRKSLAPVRAHSSLHRGTRIAASHRAPAQALRRSASLHSAALR